MQAPVLRLRWVLTPAGGRNNPTAMFNNATLNAFPRHTHLNKGGSGAVSAGQNDTEVKLVPLGKKTVEKFDLE